MLPGTENEKNMDKVHALETTSALAALRNVATDIEDHSTAPELPDIVI